MKIFIILLSIFIFVSPVNAEFMGIYRGNPESYVDIVDEFIGGSTESGEIGNQNWIIAGTSAVASNVVPWSVNNPGVKNASTQAVINSPAVLTLSTAVSALQIDADNLFDITYIIQLPSVADVTIRAGVSNNWTDYASSTSGAWFVFTTTATGQEDASMSILKWVTVTRNAGTVTYNNTTIANVAAATTYKLRIVRTSASAISFYIDGTLMFTHTTNLTSANVVPGIYVESQVAVTAKSFDIDYFRLRISGLSR